jgi:hypothetical protein
VPLDDPPRDDAAEDREADDGERDLARPRDRRELDRPGFDPAPGDRSDDPDVAEQDEQPGDVGRAQVRTGTGACRSAR